MAREKDVEIKVETICTDFEEAAIKAATKVFGVVFPYHKQNLDKKLDKKSLDKNF